MKSTPSSLFRLQATSAHLFLQDILDRLSRRATPRLVLKKLNVGLLSFFDKAPPSAEGYPYQVHYAPTLENVPSRLEKFHLIGRSWKHKPNAPVALAFGFNMWKYGFIADYCPEERIAFAPRKFLGFGARRAAYRMHPQPERVYVWGYTDHKWVERFARRRKIPLIRVEDAFLRSAGLGANHVTPYSLIFDHKGLYYNPAEPNDLFKILTTHDFAKDKALMEGAEAMRRLIIESNLSKYNLPDGLAVGKVSLAKAKRRVLVIGQVDNDAAVRMANPLGWRMGDIIRLARLENPDAEILYRPHPEVEKGFQPTRFRNSSIGGIAKIIPSDGSLGDLLASTDQVYTISSLSGLEALIRGVKVTTLGTPFYSGWGATDDRAAAPKGRVLKPLEIFAAAYLLYPRYLVPLEGAADAAESTIYRILADRQLLQIEQAREAAKGGPEAVKALLSTQYWPAAALAYLGDAVERPIDAVSIGKVPIRRTLDENRKPQFQLALLCLITGWLTEPGALATAIRTFESSVPRETLVEYFNLLVGVRGKWDTHKIISSYLRSGDESGQSLDYIKNSSLFSYEESEEDLENAKTARKKNLEYYFELLMAQMDSCSYAQARSTAYKLLIAGYKSLDVLKILHELEASQFAPDVTVSIAELLMYSPRQADYKRAIMAAYADAQSYDPQKFAVMHALLIALSPGGVARLLLPQQESEEKAEFARVSQLLLKQVYLNPEISVGKINALIVTDDVDGALETARILYEQNPGDPRSLVALSQALTAAEQLDEAWDLISSAARRNKYSVLVVKEALRVCILRGDYAGGQEFIDFALEKDVQIGEMLFRKMYFGLRKPGEAFKTFRDILVARNFQKHFPEKYNRGAVRDFQGDSLFVTPIFGPGDEIRFASIYSDLLEQMDGRRLVIGAEPRLQALIQRSFPQAEVVPVVRKTRNADPFDVSDYNQIRSLHLRGIIDNRAVEVINETAGVMVAPDALSEFRPTYDAFPGRAYLQADPNEVAKAKSLLPQGKLRVGISWRSSLNTASRREHYLSIDELFPIFGIDGIQFVNLQYDECTEEVAQVNQAYPGRLFDPAWLDQYNELDKVAALISGLDLAIAPATTVVELAGALGVPTWLLSNSSELHWRKQEGSDQDVWHHSISHVEGLRVQDKASLVEALRNKLLEWRDAQPLKLYERS